MYFMFRLIEPNFNAHCSNNPSKNYAIFYFIDFDELKLNIFV